MHIQLDTKNKEVLAETIFELENTDLFEVTKIKELLNSLNPETGNIKLWLKQMNKCVSNYDTDMFHKLIKIDEL